MSMNYYLSMWGGQIGSNTADQPLNVMCGDNPPTLTGGGAVWTTIDRPLARGLSIFLKYDPVQLVCELRFGDWTSGVWATDDRSASQVESGISTLESFWGTKITSGPPSVVYVAAFDGLGNQTDLVPKRYWNMPWIITDLQYGTSYRNENGLRIFQDATVTFENYINFGNVPKPNEQKKGGYFTTTATRRTALQIAGAPTTASPPQLQQSLASAILASSRNNPMKGSSIKLEHYSKSWKIPIGKSVWVPTHID